MARLEPGTSTPPPRGESVRPPRTSIAVTPSAAGATVRGLKGALVELVGGNVVDAALSRVSPKAREEFEPLTLMTWVPLSSVAEVVEAVASQACRKADDLMDEAVRRAAEEIFRTSWRLLLRFTSDRALIARAPVIYSKWRNIGQLEARLLAPGRAEIDLTGWPDVNERNVRTLGVSIETVLRLAGRHWVKVEWERNHDGAKYFAVWRP